jgi:hypothetical protein
MILTLECRGGRDHPRHPRNRRYSSRAESKNFSRSTVQWEVKTMRRRARRQMTLRLF